MIQPVILARVEKSNPLAAALVNRVRPRLFETVAPQAAPTQVRDAVAAAASFREDVIHDEVVPS
jgi:hypothetical protein